MLLTLLITGTGYANLNNGLVAWYPFNGSANDESGQGHDGTVYGATLTTDRFGNPNSAYSFDGVDDYVRVPDDPQLDGMNSLTLSVWVKPRGNSQEEEVLNKYNHDTGTYMDDSYNIGIDRIDGWGPLATFQYATASEKVIKISNAPLPTDPWHHIVGVYTGTKGILYVDGSEVALWRDDPDYPGPLNSTANDLLIGCGERWGSLIKFYNGMIDDVRIYDRALSESEIAALAGIPAVAAIDISPDPLSFGNRGKWVTCYIEPPEGYSVSEIDVHSVLLENLLEVQYSAVQGGVLLVKFDRQDVMAYIDLVLGVTPPADVTLMVSGQLTDGFFFAGTDVVRVIEGKKKK
jgi:hypothetical protein